MNSSSSTFPAILRFEHPEEGVLLAITLHPLWNGEEIQTSDDQPLFVARPTLHIKVTSWNTFRAGTGWGYHFFEEGEVVHKEEIVREDIPEFLIQHFRAILPGFEGMETEEIQQALSFVPTETYSKEDMPEGISCAVLSQSTGLFARTLTFYTGDGNSPLSLTKKGGKIYFSSRLRYGNPFGETAKEEELLSQALFIPVRIT